MSKSKTKTAKKSAKKAVKKAAKKSAKSGAGKSASTADTPTKDKKVADKKEAKKDKKVAKKSVKPAKKSEKKTATKAVKSVAKSVAKAKKSATKPEKPAKTKSATKPEPKAEAHTEPTSAVATSEAASRSPAKAASKPQQKKPQQKQSKTKSPFGAKAPKGESPKPGVRHPATRRHTYRPGKAATPTLKRGEHDSKWILIDADGLVLGRLASRVALRLRGKHLPTYTPHINAGDTVIIINASKVALTGSKEKSKVWYRHTGYVGGIKEETPASLRAKAPERMIRLAVSRMLPKGPLARRQLSRLKVYAGAEHPHGAQSPEVFDLGAENRKNRA